MNTRTWRVSRSGLLAVIVLLMSGCSSEVDSVAEPSNSKPLVCVVNYPLKYFAERIGDDKVEVRFPIPPNVDPAFWKPDINQIAEFQRADLVLFNGANYAKWRDKVSLSESKSIDTSHGFRDRLIQIDETVTHSHGPGGDHSHSGTAFTTWLDFEQAAQQAAAIKDALVGLSPDNAEIFELNFTSLSDDLAALDCSLREIAGLVGDQPLLASHPVYQYLARRYGLNIQSVLWEPEVVPDDEAIAQLESLLARHPAQWMIWEKEPASASIRRLDELYIHSVIFDPCGNIPNRGDYLTVMRANVEALRQIQRAAADAASAIERDAGLP